MVECLSAVRRPPSREKKGITIIQISKPFASMWINPCPLCADIPDESRLAGWRKVNEFFFASGAPLVDDICLVGIFGFAIPPSREAKNFAEASSCLAKKQEHEAITLRGSMVSHPGEISCQLPLDVLRGEGRIWFPGFPSPLAKVRSWLPIGLSPCFFANPCVIRRTTI